jgi:hypothetical protein
MKTHKFETEIFLNFIEFTFQNKLKEKFEKRKKKEIEID